MSRINNLLRRELFALGLMSATGGEGEGDFV